MSLLSAVFNQGTHSARPAAASGNNGYYYFETDTNGGTLFQSTGSAWVQLAPGVTQTGNSGWNFPSDGRLTLTTAVPVTTADVSAATTLYYTPYVGTQIALYNGATWDLVTFAEISITNAGLSASLPYDVFCYNNGGTATLELLAWTGDTNRATALAYQNGILVKSGAATRRYLGTVRVDAASKFNDVGAGTAPALRCVWNYYHRVNRSAWIQDTTSHTYSGSTRSWNNSANNRLNFVIGVVEDAIPVTIDSGMANTAAVTTAVGVGLDSTTAGLETFYVRQDTVYTSLTFGVSRFLKQNALSVGYHYLQAQEYASGTATFGVVTLTAMIPG